MAMTRDKAATVIAITISVPMVLIASFIELASMHSGSIAAKLDGYEIADLLYIVLGYPLTRIIFIFAPHGLNDIDNWWGIPLLDLLFICQWIVWARLFVLIGELIKSLWRRFFPTPSFQYVWPQHVIKADGRRFRMRAQRHSMDVQLIEVSSKCS